VIPSRDFGYDGLARLAFVRGTPDLLAQMLDKLVENAVDFAAPDTPVRVILSDDGERVTLRVENEGQPLPEALRGSTFESMQRDRYWLTQCSEY